MMIKCQKCGFENQMGSIFCRECGEKLNMDAIDPNKLQKDVNKEKNLKLAKKRIKEAISTGFGLLVVVAFLAVVFYNGGLRKYEEPAVTEASANQKYTAAVSGTSVGKVKYTYPELTRMFNAKVVTPMSELDSFAKVTAAEIVYDEEKNQPVVYLWISLKDKVPVIYTIHGDLIFNSREEGSNDVTAPLSLDVKRLDIGRLPVLVSTHTFLDGFTTLIDNEEVMNFFARAKDVSFAADGMTVEFQKGGGVPAASSSSYAPKASASAGVAALKGGSTAALSEKDEAARAKAEAAKQKAAEEAEKKKALEEESKRKAEEYRQQQKEKEEERKRKAEEEKERKKQEAEERKRKAEEEAERRRQEAEDRRREREDRRNNNYNNGRSSRSSRNRY